MPFGALEHCVWMGFPFRFLPPLFSLCSATSPVRRNIMPPPGEKGHPDAAPQLKVHESNNIDSCWNAVVGDLLENGVALLDLKRFSSSGTSCTSGSCCIPKAAFDSSIQALNLLANDSTNQQESTRCQMIEESIDSARATGYHRAGCMSARYNANREGFVFSDGQSFEVRGCASFRSTCLPLQELLHDVAENVLDTMICRHLELPEGWFHDNLGPLRDSSQWHIKRYVDVQLQDNSSQTNEASTAATNSIENGNSVEWLPTHTDPSLVSVVVLNQPGRHEVSSGLQYPKNRLFFDVPWSGHDIAIVFVGSVLQHVTGGYFRACRHRVVYTNYNSISNRERVAATLFVRPAPERTLSLPPSPALHRMNCKVKGCLTFSQWNAKVARNYEKSQQRRQFQNSRD